MQRKGRLLACFARAFGLQVGPYVMLRDHNQNEIEVAIEKRGGKVYFADGWAFLKTFYGILAGAWVTFIFANRHLFLVEVRNLYGGELEYPRLDPPLRMMLETQGAKDYRKSFVGYGSNVLFLPTVFCHTMVKQLTSEDVTSGVLVSGDFFPVTLLLYDTCLDLLLDVCFFMCFQKLNWLGFCQSALPAKPSEITLIDYLGYPWKLVMEFGPDGDMTCLFKGAWQDVCRARLLVEGSSLKFGVVESSNNNVMYLCAPRMLVLKTMLSPSASAGGTGPSYRFE